MTRKLFILLLIALMLGTLFVGLGSGVTAQSGCALTINEVMYDPSATEIDPVLGEFAELYVHSNLSASELDNFTIGDQDGTEPDFDFPNTVSVSAGDYIIVHSGTGTPSSYNADGGYTVYHFYMNRIGQVWQNSGDDIVLANGSNPCDYVAFNAGAYVDDPPAGYIWNNDGSKANNPTSSEGTSISLISNGSDSDNASDWEASGTTTTTGPSTMGNSNNVSPTAVTLSSFTATAYDGYVLVEWETASEIDTLGFNLYRSQSADGPRIRLNEALMPSQAVGSVGGASYQYTDTKVTGGVTYYYWLEDVEVGGASTIHGLVSAAAQRVYRIYLPIVLRNGPVGQRD